MSRIGLTLIVALVVGAAAANTDVNKLKLRPSATVFGSNVTLGDVVSFAGAADELEQAVADAVVITVAAGARQHVVTHDQVVSKLDALGVNLSRVLVSGALKCDVTIAAAPAARTTTSDAAPLIRAEASASKSEGAATLADRLRAFVAYELKSLGGEPEIRFDRAGQEFLALTSPPWGFNISASGRDQLGLREFRVVIRRDGHVQRTVRVYAHVRLVREVVVAQRPLSIGNFIRNDDVTLETRVFEAGDVLGLATTDEVIGQQVKRYVEKGAMLDAGALKPVDLVRRSRPVTVLGSNGAVKIRLTGVALDSGGYGDTVRVRIGDTRKTRQQLRAVVAGLGTVRMMEDTP